MESYTPGKVWSILSEGEATVDELIDLEVGLAAVSQEDRDFLVALAQGYTASSTMKKLGLRGNQTRYKREAVARLTKAMNEGDKRAA